MRAGKADEGAVYGDADGARGGAGAGQLGAFLLCGVLLDWTFVVLLAAAPQLTAGSTLPSAAVLFACIVPLWLVKLSAPLFVQRLSYAARIRGSAAAACACLALCALLRGARPIVGIAVPLGAVSTAVAEISVFALASRFPPACLVALTLGVGLSGVCASGAYLALAQTLRPPHHASAALLLLAPFPAAMCVLYDRFLSASAERPETRRLLSPTAAAADVDEAQTTMDVAAKLRFVRDEMAVPYMLPLATIFFCEYLANQAVLPTLRFARAGGAGAGDDVAPADFARFYFAYTVGGVLARAASVWLRVDALHACSALQVINLAALLLRSRWPILGHRREVLLLMIWEGAVGGVTFLNALRRVHEGVHGAFRKEFALGAVSCADATGVVAAALVGLWLEPALLRADSPP